MRVVEGSKNVNYLEGWNFWSVPAAKVKIYGG
jgi:hypothetical protein